MTNKGIIGAISLLCLLNTVFAAAVVRDPTQPPDYQGEATQVPDQLIAQAIKYGKDQKPVTVINQKVVVAGEKVYGAKVMEIHGDHVVLDAPNKGPYEVALAHTIKTVSESKSTT